MAACRSEELYSVDRLQDSSMRLELWREMGPTMPRGGGVPFTGDLHQIQVVSEGYAWNEPVPEVPTGAGAGPALPCTLPEAEGTGWAGPCGSPVPVPAPESQVECMLALSATPQGFVKAAVANQAKQTRVEALLLFDSMCYKVAHS